MTEATLNRAILALLGAVALLAAPAFAAESCDQALKDTTAAWKAAVIGPRGTTEAESLIKQAEELCKKDDAQQKSESLELLRLVRTMIGE
jgi:hypothetical protein